MSASPDQSYYEIALTNRQVMSIFVVLLVCILAAFLGGVWLGRDADAAVEIVAAQSINAGQIGDAPLEELDFFTRRDDAGKAADTLARAPAKSEEAQASEKSVSKSAEGPASPAPENEKVPAVVTEAPVPRADDSGAPSEPAARPAGAESRDPGARAKSADVAAAVPESVVIQVFSSNEEAQAQRVVERLRNGGYPASLSPVEVAGRTLHRVRLGPYTDPDEAQVVAESVRRAFKLDTWITH